MTTPEVPDFDLIRQIGSGGFGHVWLAVNQTTSRLRAVKVISLQGSGQTDPAGREISSLTRLEANLRCRHPNLLNIHHVGKTTDHLFYVMDPADDARGGPASDSPEYQPSTLQAQLQSGPLPPEVCSDYARQLLAGLASLHAAGMVHRDVKPANCLFVDGQLKLADFGLLTEAHPLVSCIGTQKYMPPDGRMDMRADVYAAGLVIYEMLTGLPVDDFPRLGRQSLPIGGNPTLANLLRIVLRACERDPTQRFADAQKMLADFDKPVKTFPRPLKRRFAVAACAVAVLIAAIFGHRMFRPQRAPSPTGVAVSFITVPYEAEIYLDGTLLKDSTGKAYNTPCTVDNLPTGVHRVEFEWDDLPRWDGGQHDFTQTRQIVGSPP